MVICPDWLTGEVIAGMIDKQSIAEIARIHDCSASTLRSRLWRHRTRLEDQIKNRDELFRVDLGDPPMVLDGDFVIVGDVQLPTTDLDFAMRPAMIAEKFGIKRLIIAGDLFNLDSFSRYENIVTLPNWKQEKAAAAHLIKLWLQVFDHIFIISGNHEYRLPKYTSGAMDIYDLVDLFGGGDNVTASHHGHCVVNTSNGEWRVTHNRNYSIQPLNVASQLALKFQQHIICHHQHHLAMGRDRYNRYTIIDNGGLFDQNKMAYVTIEDSKLPNMVQGFTMLKGGYATIIGDDSFTDWNEVLGDTT